MNRIFSFPFLLYLSFLFVRVREGLGGINEKTKCLKNMYKVFFSSTNVG